MTTIDALKNRYRDEWILVEVLKEDENGKPLDVKMISHSKKRDDIYSALKDTKGVYTFQFFAGSIPKKGYALQECGYKKFKVLARIVGHQQVW